MEVAIGVAALAVAILIAWQQGAFRRARVRVKLGPAEPKVSPWAAFVVVPDLPVTHYLVTVPIEVVSVGSDAVRSVRVQVQHDRAASVLNLTQMEVDLHKELLTRSGIARNDILIGQSAVSDYELPILRREETAMIGHPLAIPKELVFDGRESRLWVARVGLQVAAENSPLKLANSYIVVMGTRDGELDEAVGERMGQGLLLAQREHEKPRSYIVWKWRDPDRALETRWVVNICPKWLVAKQRIAFEAQLKKGTEPTEYSLSKIELIDLTPRGIARRAAKQLGKLPRQQA